MSGGLDVRGGSGGVAADVVDMRRTAATLHHLAGEIERVALRSRGVVADPDLLASVLFSPLTAATAETRLLGAVLGPQGLALRAVALRGQALVLTSRVGLLELADSGRLLAGEVRNAVGGRLIGAGLLPVGVPLAAALYGGHLGSEVLDTLGRAVSGEIPWSAVDDELRADPGDAGTGLGGDLESLLLAHPGVVDVVTGGSPQLGRGLLGPLGPLLPGSYEGMLSLLRSLGDATGTLQDDAITLVPGKDPVPRTLQGVEGILVSQGELMTVAGAGSDDGRSALRVLRVPQPDGTVRFVLQVPGTQQWDPAGTGDPSDVTTNLALMEGTDPAMLAAMAAALREAGHTPGDRVLLTGHSQGGIAAAAFAADPALRAEFGVDAILTAGSPIARMDIGADVSVLALEHSQDPVPRLDGRQNPDRPAWTTVRLDTSGQGFTSPMQAHGLGGYAATGAQVDGSDAPSVRTWLDEQAGFLLPGTFVDHDIRR